MTDTAAVRRKLDLARIFRDTFGVVRRQAPLLFGLTIGLTVITALLGGIYGLGSMNSAAAGDPTQALATVRSPAYWGVVLISVLVNVFLFVCQTWIAIRDLDGERPTLGEALQLGLRKSLPAVAAFVLLLLGVWLGMLFLFVPGIILALMWSVTLPAVVGETSNVFRAFGRSRALTRGNRWRILGLTLIVFLLLMILYGVFFGAVGGLGAVAAAKGSFSIGVVLVSLILGVVQSIVFTVGSAALYVQLRELKGGGGESVAQVFA